MPEPFATRGFELHPWQQDAVSSWVSGDHLGRFRGTLEVFTGGGKSMIALACAAEAAKIRSNLRLLIVVPTVALADQWRDLIMRYTTVKAAHVKKLTGRAKPDGAPWTVLITVINTAAKKAPLLELDPATTMLIIDECHRAGAPTFQKVLKTKATYRLGLSATPERDEVDSKGEPLRFDQQVVAKRLGQVVYTFSLSDATRQGWLPEYRIVHHAVQLQPKERVEYDRRSRKIDELADQLSTFGLDPSRARAFQKKPGDRGAAARAYLAATTARKDMLFRAEERRRIAETIVAEALVNPVNRILLFNERIEEASLLYDRLSSRFGEGVVALEHSKLGKKERSHALIAFRQGVARVLISAKSLIEGLDVPHATVGISVASTGSVRQRIQSLGRVLRRFTDSQQGAKRAEMHLIYVHDSADEAIYAKEDWADLTGAARNRYLLWSLEPTLPPTEKEDPPRRPLPTEEQERQRLGETGNPGVRRWKGSLAGQEYSVDTRGNVVNAFGVSIANPQGVFEMLEAVRGRPGGKFIVTPRYRFILVSRRDPEGTTWWSAGNLQQPFEAGEGDEADDDPNEFKGPLNATNGTYMIRSRRGGVIERAVSRDTWESAEDVGENKRASNARSILNAWKKSQERGVEFYINDRWDAWYRTRGRPKFLAHVPIGLEWPTQRGKDET